MEKFFETRGFFKRSRPLPDIADRIWNCDEMGFCLGVASKKVLARRGAKFVHDTAGGSDRSYITVHCCGSASGIRLVPYVLFKGVYLYKEWTTGGPAGALYGMSESGWMETKNFLDWFKKGFLPAVRHLLKTGPVVLFFDGHSSHLALNLLRVARSESVDLYTLPSHTSHILQPLDVAVYGPMKAAWREILQQYKLETRASNADKKNFTALLSKLWDRSLTPAQLRAGFRATGIYPFNRKAVSDAKIATSIPFTQGKEASKASSTSATVPPVTPVRAHLTGYFAELLQPKVQQKVGGRKRIKPAYHGEALTLDDVYSRIESEEAEKAERAAAKKKGGKKGRPKKSQEEVETHDEQGKQG